MALIFDGASIRLKIIEPDFLAFPISGPNYVACPAAKPPNRIGKIL